MDLIQIPTQFLPSRNRLNSIAEMLAAQAPDVKFTSDRTTSVTHEVVETLYKA